MSTTKKEVREAVLIVDDDAAIRMLIYEYVRYTMLIDTVFQAESGDVACEILKLRGHQIACVVTDFDCGDGAEKWHATLDHEGRPYSVILISGGEVPKGTWYDTFISKPIPLTMLGNRIRDYVSPEGLRPY